MTELFYHAFHGFNLPITILLLALIGFWILSVLGTVEIDFLDTTLGLDTDIDAGETDASATDSGSQGGPSNFISAVLRFVGAADAPVTLVLTIFVAILWGGNLIGNATLNEEESNKTATIVLLSSAVISFVLTRFVVRALKPFTKYLVDKEVQVPVEGRTAMVRSAKITETVPGQISAEGGILLMARCSVGTEDLKKGDSVIVISKDDQQDADIYLVRKLDSIANI